MATPQLNSFNGKDQVSMHSISHLHRLSKVPFHYNYIWGCTLSSTQFYVEPAGGECFYEYSPVCIPVRGFDLVLLHITCAANDEGILTDLWLGQGRSVRRTQRDGQCLLGKKLATSLQEWSRARALGTPLRHLR
jgi:hypothetical protein